jgi:predicted homoserine dehydrogenase-like protein
MKQNIHRRRFLLDTSAAFALAAFKVNNLNFFSQATPRRVALIGTGWYGKSDLFRLMQVAPIDVVALCDVDKQQLNKAAEMVSQRQKIIRSRLYMVITENYYQNKNRRSF